MIKTGSQIERDFYALISASSLGKGIKGKVYRSEMRPADATSEDIIVKFLAGEDEQVQTGVVICNIYVPDVTKAKGRKVIDHARIAELELLVLSFIENFDSSEYLIKTDGSMQTYLNEEINQHLISVRIKFQRLNH
jgi:hypothetical protein